MKRTHTAKSLLEMVAALGFATLTMMACQQQTQTARAAKPAQQAKNAANAKQAMATATVKPEPLAAAENKLEKEPVQRSEDGVKLATSPAEPFAVWSSHAGEVNPGEVFSLTFTLQPAVPVNAVTTTVRGVKGPVVSGTLTRKHERLKAAAKLRHEVQVRADKGVAGYVAIDIRWQGPEGAGSTTVVTEVRAKGAAIKLEKLGKVETDSNGQRVQVMNAEMR